MKLAAAALALRGAARSPTRAPRDAADEDGAKHLPYYVAMDPPIVYPGAIIRLQVRPPAGATGGSVFVAGRRYLGQIEDGMFVAYFAVDIDTLPGPYELSATTSAPATARASSRCARGAWTRKAAARRR